MFDACAAARALRNAGFDEPQAEAAVATVRDAVPEGVATGEDAARIEGRVGSEIGRIETRPTVRMYGGSVATAAVAVALLKLLP